LILCEIDMPATGANAAKERIGSELTNTSNILVIDRPV
jgi:hypothetical protein